MRFSKLLLKVFTLAFFLLLIAGFVWYRIWYQEEKTRLSNVVIPPIDTTRKIGVTDTAVVVSPAYLSSSKSISLPPDILIDWSKLAFDFQADSNMFENVQTDVSRLGDTLPPRQPVLNTYMLGSKSGYIYPALPDSTQKAGFKAFLDSMLKKISSTKKQEPWDSSKQ